MPPNPTSKPRRTPGYSDEQRHQRLRTTVRLASWWFCAQGLLYLFLSERVASLCGLRFKPDQAPYVHLAGLSLLCLGFFLVKALRDPKRHYLAVDILILYLLGHVYLLLSFRLDYNNLTPFEWFSGAVDLGLGTGLALFRTRSSQMQGAGSLLADPLQDFARATGQWILKKGPAPRPTWGDLEAKVEDGDSGSSGESQDKTQSKAIPHLD